jgi:DNA polymerase
MAHAILETAAPLVPERPTLEKLRAAAAGCTACPLYRTGTQTVFGEGMAAARAIFVGEQPGDSEDRAGRPFVTNVVKHFKWTARGKRRLHEKPNAREIAACRPWLEAELAVVKPEVLVCLGATAAQALLGKSFKVTQMRGEILRHELANAVMATVHPSSILRAPDDESRRREMELFIRDLRHIAPLLQH